jgi:hypothetical protein
LPLFLWLLHAAAIASGLACGTGETRSPMDGEWKAGNPQVDACAQAWTFRGDEFELSRYCALSNGDVGLEITRGSFIIDGDQITLTRTQSTCANSTRDPLVLSFVVERNKLTLVSTSGVFTLARGGLDLVAGARATFGCFDDAGVFTAGGLIDLP